jgi:hypothetical protein
MSIAMIIKNEIDELQINILKRSNTQAEDYWDANWLEAEVKIRVRGFSCLYGTNLRTDDFQRFYNDALLFSYGNRKEIEFRTMEEGLYLKFEAGPNGMVFCVGKAKDDEGNSLEFKFEIDNTATTSLISQLTETLKFYPVMGSA